MKRFLVKSAQKLKRKFYYFLKTVSGRLDEHSILRKSELFDSSWYLSEYSDVKAAGFDPVSHYISHGWKEGRDPGPKFKTRAYLKQNTDVAKAGVNPLLHYIVNGRNEKRALAARGAPTIAVVSHDASATGAPIIALHITRILKQEYGMRVAVLLLRGGVLEPDFAQHAEVIRLDDGWVSVGKDETKADSVVAGLKQAGVSSAICNTVVSATLITSFKKHGVRCISLIHELPTVIDILGAGASAAAAATEADAIVFPAKFVRDAFNAKYPIADYASRAILQPQGVLKKNPYAQRKAWAKREWCGKLKIAPNSHIVIGCGNADLRKGVDIFSQLACTIVNVRARVDMHFVWVGAFPNDGITAWIKHDLTVMGIAGNVHFLNFCSDPASIFAASDAFVLTSREDPFPTVVLEAMDARTPAVIFADAGGACDAVANGCGSIVPYLDIPKMADEVLCYVDNPAHANLVATAAKKRADEEFENVRYVGRLLDILKTPHSKPAQKLLEALPTVSVIVPNYNYASYLPERISSILAQTYVPCEIIFLDDRSTDNSLEVARELLKDCEIPYQIVHNDINLGCFGQWIKGIDLAKGELVWIAEADDTCRPKLLESLAACFRRKDVALAYCQSQIIGSDGTVFQDSYHWYTDDLSSEKWATSYVRSGTREVNDGMAIKNTIPNASAVVMRKSATRGLAEALASFKMAGDWRAYLHVLGAGNIAYVNEVLNSHRRHAASIIDRTEKSPAFFQELLAIQKSILEAFLVRDDVYLRMKASVRNEYARLCLTGGTSPATIEAHPDLKTSAAAVTALARTEVLHQTKGPLTFVIVMPDMEFGGGQIVAVNQANYIARTNRVVLYNARPGLADPLLRSKIAPDVEIADADGTPENLLQIMRAAQADAIISNIWWSDKLVYKALQQTETAYPWILVMHGCYEMLIHHPECDPEFDKLLVPMFQRTNQLVYTADKNLEVVDTRQLKLRTAPLKMRNGLAPENVNESDLPHRADHGVEEHAFVFGLCARAIPEKGWELAIESVIALRNGKKCARPVHLFLIGHGAYSEVLESRFASYPYIHFLGNRSDLHCWLKMFDAILLPTNFKSESQPMIIIDALSQGRPVIATEIGEIANMLCAGETRAGLLVPLVDGKPDAQALLDGMLRFVADTDGIYTRCKTACPALFKQFDMRGIVEQYLEIAGFKPSISSSTRNKDVPVKRSR